MTIDGVDIIGAAIASPSAQQNLLARASQSIQQLAKEGDPLALVKLRQEELEQNPVMVNIDETFDELAEQGDPVALATLQNEAYNAAASQHIDQYV